MNALVSLEKFGVSHVSEVILEGEGFSPELFCVLSCGDERCAKNIPCSLIMLSSTLAERKE